MSSGKFGPRNTRSATLNELDVVEIREKYWQQGFTQGALARAKGVSVNTIGRIVRGESWQHVGGVGMHAAATESPAAANVLDAAHQQAAQATPMTDAAKASLTALKAMLGQADKQQLEEESEDGETKE